MKNKFLSVIIIIVLIELGVVGFLIYNVKQKQKEATADINIDPIKQNSISYNPNSKLKFFYEPIPNDIAHDTYDWLKIKPTYTINADALNSRYNYPVKKEEGTFRIITLGDSFTYGLFVSTPDNWPSVLEDSLNSLNCSKVNKFEVINLGVSGYDIQYSVERYKLRGQKYNPDFVLWFLKDDDFVDIVEETAASRKKYSDDMIKKGTYQQEEAKRGKLQLLTYILKLAKDDLRKKYGTENLFKYQQQVFDEFNKYYSGKLLIFDAIKLGPPYTDFLDSLIKNNPNYSFVNSNFTRFNHEQYSFLPYDKHPNQEGHKIISQDLLHYLINNKIIPCN